MAMNNSLNDVSLVTNLTSNVDEVFWIRFNCVLNWYLKASNKIKLKLLNSMLDSFKDETYLPITLPAFNFTVDKLIMYSDCQSRTNYIYDIYLKDHDRGLLDEEFLLATIHKDLVWYNNLEVNEQIATILELLNVSGGAIIKIIYGAVLDKIKKRAKAKAREEAMEVIEDKVDLNELFLPKATDVEQNDKKEKKDKKDKKGKKKEAKKPKTPLEVEIDHKKKAWDDAMKKYRIAVEGKPDKGKGKGKGKDKSSGKSSKSSKSSKSGSKKSKKSKKGDKYLVDRVQMLPVWIVKKIFSYLDAKTLKKVSDVNHYWAYVVEDVVKDRKNMAAVQKIVNKMKANLSTEEVPDLTPIIGKLKKMTQLEKRMIDLAERGAVDNKVRTVLKQPAEGKTLLERAIESPDIQISVPTQGYESFPRAQGDKLTLLALPKTVYTEAGVFKYGKKPEGGAVTIVELPNYTTIGSALHLTEHEEGTDE